MGYIYLLFATLAVASVTTAIGDSRGKFSRYLIQQHYPDICSHHPCRNGGTCEITYPFFTCSCPREWKGRFCEVADHCASNPCHHNAVCTNNHHSIFYDSGYTCECPAGWTGTNCDTDVDECASNSWQHLSSCINSPGSFTYNCSSGWTGPNCETDIDECTMGSICKHASSCTNTVGSYSCKCLSGWTGPQCDLDINECINNPCKHSSHCTNTPGSFTCSCLSGWSGSMCDIDIDECALYHFCQNGATCTNFPGFFNCTCPAGWTGTQCGQVMNQCDSYPCKNGASCYGNQTMYTCHCTPGYTGAVCDKHVCGTKNPCQNGAACTTDQNGQYTCNCLLGWSGHHCDTGIPKQCGHLCSLESVVKASSVNNAKAAACSTSFASNEALLMQCCDVDESSHWIKGSKVMSQCQSGTMTPYTPVAAYKNDGTLEEDTAGVLTACLSGGVGFVIIRQACSSAPQMFHVNGTNTGLTQSNPDNYHVIL
ncbi:fibropellin-1-like isoform X4 [Mercenaria mercenaria]|uniref:fibropellin-1-like isoform X4 n=1 Tax=Mercenaria mercenaria TaxID=6596 RepID=UPI00234F32FA|nr:fibropellin-1-like isoform X4 [Mercenaria mercenaria]